MRVKICGITTVDDAKAAVDAGVDAIGLNFYAKSPRYVSENVAETILRALPPFVAVVGVFVDTPEAEIVSLVDSLGLDVVQTYSPNRPESDFFPASHLPAFRVKDAESLTAIDEYLPASAARAILVDSYVPGLMGGSGQIAPWSLLQEYSSPLPLILAGGLTPENVREAIAIVRPWGVDVAGGVEESPGKKDRTKMAVFIREAKQADLNFS